jgi:hypothetical protein
VAGRFALSLPFLTLGSTDVSHRGQNHRNALRQSALRVPRRRQGRAAERERCALDSVSALNAELDRSWDDVVRAVCDVSSVCALVLRGRYWRRSTGALATRRVLPEAGAGAQAVVGEPAGDGSAPFVKCPRSGQRQRLPCLNLFDDASPSCPERLAHRDVLGPAFAPQWLAQAPSPEPAMVAPTARHGVHAASQGRPSLHP